MKKIFVLFVALCCFGNLFCLEWAITNGKTTLTISGEGPMPDFEDKEISGGKDIPWNQYAESIDTIVIREGITSVGDNAFAYMFNLKKVYIPESMEVIGYGAFDWCPKLIDINFPEGLMKIGDRAFLYSDLLKDVTLYPNVDVNVKAAFSHGTRIHVVGQEKEKKRGSF